MPQGFTIAKNNLNGQKKKVVLVSRHMVEL